ncbi:HAD domain-containing protein [Paraburkholderia adhaesiva]|uniref:HAD domain-containing protein n=1 Tax=Paraburkholderia adhaesiva TaxID=2883244 RepID=UPI001EEB2E3C|nr:HAD domain-containing protein [Paraburkholderia adhaesiva]
MPSPTIFLDYDGTLHRGNSYATPDGIVSSAPSVIDLFEFAPILNELLLPYPDIRIVLSTDWCVRFGFEQAKAALPLESLVRRVIGTTYAGEDLAAWTTLARGAQVLGYVARHRISKWLAIDDRRDGFATHPQRLIHCQTDAGLGDPAVTDLLRQRLFNLAA